MSTAPRPTIRQLHHAFQFLTDWNRFNTYLETARTHPPESLTQRALLQRALDLGRRLNFHAAKALWDGAPLQSKEYDRLH